MKSNFTTRKNITETEQTEQANLSEWQKEGFLIIQILVHKIQTERIYLGAEEKKNQVDYNEYILKNLLNWVDDTKNNIFFS